jgi:RNA polymerase sigma factor for flagellar operon FliA
VDRKQLEATFVANLPAIERMSRAVARRSGLSADETDDFVAQVNMKLVQDDYAVLQRFRGESSITTYLAVVIATQMRDYRVKEWGRWRPSAAALRYGEVGIRLETLIRRQGHTLREAGEILRRSGFPAVTDRELGEMMKQLPNRPPPRSTRAAQQTLDTLPSAGGADTEVLDADADLIRKRAETQLSLALDELEPEDRLMIRMRFWQGMSIADIARALSIPQKPIYRRMDHSLERLRRRLQSEGCFTEDVRVLFTDAAD